MEKKKEMLISILLEMLLAGVKEVQVQLEKEKHGREPKCRSNED